MKKLIIYSLLIMFVLVGKYTDIQRRNTAKEEAMKELDREFAEKVKIHDVNEGYEGQVIIEVDGTLYEYVYNVTDSEYLGEF